MDKFVDKCKILSIVGLQLNKYLLELLHFNLVQMFHHYITFWDQCSSEVLNIDQEIDGTPVLDLLKSKHPPAQQASSATLLPPNDHSPEIHPILFEAITGNLIRSNSLRVQGSARPSGIDAAGRWRICRAFHGASKELCIALAAMTRRICTSFVDPSGPTTFVACRLVPLNKNPGVRPIGIYETIRRIISKAILKVTRVDIL